MKDKHSILLHTCCAPCAAGCIERLRHEGYRIKLLFSNSNIFPRSEYDLRLENARKIAAAFDLEIICDDYDHLLDLEYG